MMLSLLTHFDYNADENTFDYAMEMRDVSMEEFEAQVRCLLPYLSEGAKLQLKESGLVEYTYNTYKVNEDNLTTKESANEECKKYFNSVNGEIKELSQIIISAIEYDIKTKYIPNNEYILD